MLAIAPNPGFPLLAAGLLMLAMPAALRAPSLALAALASIWMLFAPAFGASHAFEQLGVVIVAVRMDALSQVFGLALALTALISAVGQPIRRNRQEDAALGLHIGGAATAVFTGDLVSFLAASELSALAGGWLILAARSQTGLAAGMGYLLWNAPASILLLAGCAFQLAVSSSSAFEAIDLTTVGGALLAAGLLVRVGAFLAHPWLKDAAQAASSAALAAIVVSGPLLAFYALSRAFPGTPLFAYVGLGMALAGFLFALIESDLRRAFAALVGAQFGLGLVILSAPGATGVTASAGFMITVVLAALALGGGVASAIVRGGAADARALTRAAMPLSFCAAVVGGLSLAGLPGLAGGVAAPFALPALHAVAGPLTGVLAPAWAGLTAVCALRIVAAAFFAPVEGPKTRPEGVSIPMIGLLLAIFLCLAVGVAPAWLEALAPTPARIAIGPAGLLDQALAIAAAAVVLALGVLTRAVRIVGLGRPHDVDAFYVGPVFAFARWIGVLTLRLFGAFGALASWLSGRGAKLAAAVAEFADRPHRPGGPGMAAAVGAAAAILFLVYILV